MEEPDWNEMAQDVYNMFMVFVDNHKRSDEFSEVVNNFIDWIEEVITNELSPKDLSTVDTYLKALGIYEKTQGDKKVEENKE